MSVLCMCEPVGVYNYSDMQGDSPRSWESYKERRRKSVKEESAAWRQGRERFKGREYK